MDLSNQLKKNGGCFTFTEYHEHPDGGDRGGTLQETHNFVFSDGLLSHEWSHDYPGEAEDFGLDECCVCVLKTQDDAVSFVEEEVSRLQQQLADAEAVLEATRKATTYEDLGGYEFDVDEDED